MEGYSVKYTKRLSCIYEIWKNTEALYAMAKIISGLDVDDPARLSELVCELM